MWELSVTMKAVNKLETQLFTKTCNKRTEEESVSQVGRKQAKEMPLIGGNSGVYCQRRWMNRFEWYHIQKNTMQIIG